MAGPRHRINSPPCVSPDDHDHHHHHHHPSPCRQRAEELGLAKHHDEKMEQWQETMHMMVALSPERRPRFPRNDPWRGCCFRFVRSAHFERLVLLVIGAGGTVRGVVHRGGGPHGCS